MQGLLHIANKPCTLASMSYPHPSTGLPAKALREYQKIANFDWGTGVPLTELLKRINRVAAHLAPEEDGQHSRVKRLYTDRSFRHYTTLGCIDPSEKEGRRSVYRFRHLVQALLVRKLLWGRVPSEQIAVVMSGRGTEETEQMFLGGIEMVARADGGEGGSAVASAAPGTVEAWKRVRVASGVELHVRNDLPKLGVAELKELIARLETALRGNFR
jgi:DNA-binding transcriptional MerR regulator